MRTMDISPALLSMCLALASCGKSHTFPEQEAGTDSDSDADSDSSKDADSDTDSDTESNIDTGTDTDTDTDVDTDTETNSDTGTDTSATGSYCTNPILVPDVPSYYTFYSDWAVYPTGLWFQLDIPAWGNLGVQRISGPFINLSCINSCASSTFLAVGTDTLTYANPSGSTLTVWLSVEEYFPLGSGLIDISINRF